MNHSLIVNGCGPERSPVEMMPALPRSCSDRDGRRRGLLAVGCGCRSGRKNELKFNGTAVPESAMMRTIGGTASEAGSETATVLREPQVSIHGTPLTDVAPGQPAQLQPGTLLPVP